MAATLPLEAKSGAPSATVGESVLVGARADDGGDDEEVDEGYDRGAIDVESVAGYARLVMLLREGAAGAARAAANPVADRSAGRRQRRRGARAGPAERAAADERLDALEAAIFELQEALENV